MNSPTHEEIARRAQEIWSLRGNPSGHDTAIWLEAERQLTVNSPETPHSDSAETSPSFDPFGRNLVAAKNNAIPADPDEVAAKAALQKRSASAPQLPTHKNARRSAPPESGKPLWDKPHSS